MLLSDASGDANNFGGRSIRPIPPITHPVLFIAIPTIKVVFETQQPPPEDALVVGLEREPRNPDLIAAQGLVLASTGQEDSAIDLLGRHMLGSEREAKAIAKSSV